MCEFKDLIDASPLAEIIKLIYEGKEDEFDSLLKRSLSPTLIDGKYISLAGWNFDTVRTIYLDAKPSTVIEGWQLLHDKQVPIDVYTEALLITSLYAWLSHNSKNNIKVDKEKDISNVLEPEILELLRLCYWINKCKRINEKEIFEVKFKDIRGTLRFRHERKFRKQLKDKFIAFGKVGKNRTIPFAIRQRHTDQFMKELKLFRENVSSFVSEFMLAALVRQEGFNSRFIAATEAKTSDLLVQLYPTEIKTFLDIAKKGRKVESTLAKEMQGTLRRTKAVHYINNSLSKNAEIIIMNLTFTSLGSAIAKYTFNEYSTFLLSKALKKAISIAEQNRKKSMVEQIPLVVFTTFIDMIGCEYKTFFYTVPYPVKRKNDNKLQANDKRLSIKFDT